MDKTEQESSSRWETPHVLEPSMWIYQYFCFQSLTWIPEVVKYGISNFTLMGGFPSLSSASTLGSPKWALIKYSFPPYPKGKVFFLKQKNNRKLAMIQVAFLTSDCWTPLFIPALVQGFKVICVFILKILLKKKCRSSLRHNSFFSSLILKNSDWTVTHSCTITPSAVDRAHAHGTTQEIEPDETQTAAAKARPRLHHQEISKICPLPRFWKKYPSETNINNIY